MKVTASLVLYKTLPDHLSAVLGSTLDSCIERIYLIDNSPTDELRSYSNSSPKIEYIWGHGNIGYGSGHNVAIRKVVAQGARYHVVLNPDISFDTAVIKTLADYMDEFENIGQIMPKVVYPDGKLQYLCKLLPTPGDLFGRRFFPLMSRDHRYEMRASGYIKAMEVPFLSGCFMFCRVDALDKIGGFDDRYFMYCEDMDLCRRIGMAGYKTMFYPGATVVHHHEKESYKNRRMLVAHVRSAVKYFNKWGWLFDGYRKKVNNNAIKQYQ